MIYKQHVIDEYYKDKAKPVRAAIGFYWAMHSRDMIQDIADSFIKTLPMIQEIEPEVGGFYKLEDDHTELCQQDVMDYIDVAMYNAISDSNNNKRKWKNYLPTEELQQKTWNFLDNNFKVYESLSDVEKKNYLNDILWNYDDYKESFQYGMKRFTNSIIEKFMFSEIDEETGEPIDPKFHCTVKDLYDAINELKEINKGMPTKRDDTEPHSDDEMDLITRAMFSDDYISEVIDFILE